MRARLSALTGAALIAACAAAPAAAQVPVRVLGNFSNQQQSTDVEQPFFKGLGKATNGMFTVQFRTMDELGMRGIDAMRQLKLGIFDVMAIQLGYVSGDEPFVLGLDLPGIAPDLATQRKVVDAYRDAFSKRLAERHGAELIAVWPYSGQVFYCRDPIAGFGDLKGKKVRTQSSALAKLVEHFGGISVTLPFPEVYQSLQRGVIDCAITGTIAGYTAKWFEVSNHLYPLPIAWSVQAHVVNSAFWKKLSPEQRNVLTAQFKKMEDDLWTLARDSTQEGVFCNTGTGPCKSGTPAKMTLAKIDQADVGRLKDAAEKVVLPSWAADCNRTYPTCSRVWNDTIGKTIGLAIK